MISVTAAASSPRYYGFVGLMVFILGYLPTYFTAITLLVSSVSGGYCFVIFSFLFVVLSAFSISEFPFLSRLLSPNFRFKEFLGVNYSSLSSYVYLFFVLVIFINCLFTVFIPSCVILFSSLSSCLFW